MARRSPVPDQPPASAPRRRSARPAKAAAPPAPPQSPPGYRRDEHSVHLLFRPDIVADPEIYRRAIRELPPVFWDEVGKVWVCSGYAESVEVLRDHTRFSAARLPDPEALAARGLTEVGAVARMMTQQMLFLDPPTHTAIRSSLKRAFTPAAVRARENEVRHIVDTAVAVVPTDGRVDIVAAFAGALPTQLIASRLGLDDRLSDLLRWAEAYETVLGSLATMPHVSDRSVIPELLDAWSSLREVARQRRGRDGEDLVTLLTNGLAPPDLSDDRLDEALDRVAANCIVLLGGGYQTLTQLISMGLVRLAQHPEQLAALRAEPELVASAVDEIMRLEGSSQYVARQATAPVELGGAHIGAGQAVVVLLGAANLDPRQFPDPHRFDIRRRQGTHLGFALGRHHCLGSIDAEQAGRLALTAFLTRITDLRVPDDKEAVVWGTHANTRAPESVLLDLGRAATEPPAALEVATPPGPAGRRPFAERLSAVDLATLRSRVDPAVDLTGELLWMDRVAELAALHPDAPALESPRAAMTYADLHHAGTVLAAELQDAGVEPGVTVAVVMDRDVEAYVAAYAVNRAGAAFLTADLTCPPDRLRAMLAEARVGLVLTQAHLVEAVRPLVLEDVPVRPVDALSLMAAPDPGPVVSGVRAGDLAYVVFTSGSTGTPKAIAIDHEALINLQVGLRQVYRITPADRVLQWFSPNFDGWHCDVMLGLTAGATMVIVEAPNECVGPKLLRTLRDRRVSVALLTPTAWQTVAAEDLGGLTGLRLAGCAGEVCTAATIARLHAPGRRVLNLYGPAEAAVWSTWHECQPGTGDPPIGTAIANKHAYVLDPTGRPVPTGDVGELWLGGVGIGRYLRQPRLMRARFRPDPLATRPGQLMYATGDLCRWRVDGRIDYVGRADRQVKIRGQRIELEEIERVLCSLPGVSHASVYLADDKLTATVVGVVGHSVDAESTRSFLRGRVHSAMVPSVIQVVERAELSTTGKLALRQELPPVPAAPPAPVAAAGARIGVPLDPRLDARLTWRLARYFAACLELPQAKVRHDSDFFDLGGDSLSIAELLTAVEDDLGVVLDVASLVPVATPEGIARTIQERQAAPSLAG